MLPRKGLGCGTGRPGTLPPPPPAPRLRGGGGGGPAPCPHVAPGCTGAAILARRVSPPLPRDTLTTGGLWSPGRGMWAPPQPPLPPPAQTCTTHRPGSPSLRDRGCGLGPILQTPKRSDPPPPLCPVVLPPLSCSVAVHVSPPPPPRLHSRRPPRGPAVLRRRPTLGTTWVPPPLRPSARVEVAGPGTARYGCGVCVCVGAWACGCDGEGAPAAHTHSSAGDDRPGRPQQRGHLPPGCVCPPTAPSTSWVCVPP